MEVMEFFVNGADVLYEKDGSVEVLTEGSQVVSDIIDKISELYPQAYKALCSYYKKSQIYQPHFRFLIARRFCKCNFGNLDHTRKDLDGFMFNFERVSCPMLDECPLEGIVCQPKMETVLSDGEKRVMKLVCDGKSNQEIADELYLSPNTVKRHISNAYLKTRKRNRAEFVKYANDNSIFK